MMIAASKLPLHFSVPGRSAVEHPNLPAELLAGYNMGFFFVPTELVVHEPGVVTPKQGRWWEVDLVLYCGTYLPRALAETRPLWSQRGISVHAAVVELWEDWGDDGHTDYELSGYMLVPSSAREHLETLETMPWIRRRARCRTDFC